MKRRLLTKEGYRKFQDELNFLWHKERPEITKIVSWAASLGDRSENADYQYNKRKLREIDRRVRFLTKLLEEAHTVEYHPDQDGKIYFGAWITLEDDLQATVTFRIVGEEEIYGQEGYISLQSPMAQACLGKTIDDEISVITPKGKKTWYVIDIHYDTSTSQ